MARKKKEPVIKSADVAEMTEVKTNWPKITHGSHSTRIEHEDGTVDFHTDWEALQRDVRTAIAEYESKNNSK